MAVLSVGCGAGFVPIVEASVAVPEQDDGAPKVQEFFWISKGTGPNGEDEIHYMSSSTSFDAVEGYGNAHFNGSTFVVEEMSTNFYTYPLDKDDWLYEEGIGRANVSISLRGSFVPGNGKVTEAMDQLEGLPLGIGGTESLDSFEISNLFPDCEKCPSWEPMLWLSWNCHAEYQQDESVEEGKDGDYSFANCHININGGTILRPYISVGEVIDDDPTDDQEPYTEWHVDINFDIIITGDYEDGTNGTPTSPTDGGGGGSGDGKG